MCLICTRIEMIKNGTNPLPPQEQKGNGYEEMQKLRRTSKGRTNHLY